MYSIYLVVLVAGSALAVPTQERSPALYANKTVSSLLVEKAYNVIDASDTNQYVSNLVRVVEDVANKNDTDLKTLALGQAIAIIALLSTGIPGDACGQATYFGLFLEAERTGNSSTAQTGVIAFTEQFITDLEIVVTLMDKPNEARAAVGPGTGCKGSGREYDFESVWNVILNSTDSNKLDIMNREYQAAKDLYRAFDVRSNVIGSLFTCMATEPILNVFKQADSSMVKVLKAVSTGVNTAGAVESLRKDLRKAIATL